jgi:hypothetical protein
MQSVAPSQMCVVDIGPAGSLSAADEPAGAVAGGDEGVLGGGG